MTLKKIGSILQTAALRARPCPIAPRSAPIFRFHFSVNSSCQTSSIAPLVARNGTRRRTTLQPYTRAPLSSQSTSFPDPSRPDLFYHLVDPPTPFSSSAPAFALSFLSSPPAASDSRTIIGWLPAQSKGSDEGAGLNDFKENRTSFAIHRGKNCYNLTCSEVP
jgi:hypothetical protein